MSESLMRVAVVRPKKDWADVVGYVLAGIGLTALIGWILMLIAGAVTPWHPSYWQSVLALVGLRLVQVGSGWTQWTWPSKKAKP